jgi:hypothetical protein
MSNLEKAAQAVLDRWDSPQWEWMTHGPTAALMADLRRALAAHKEQAEPVVERINAGPVGYRYKYPDGDWRFSGGIKINGCEPIDPEPVYTHPALKQQQAEPVQAEPMGGEVERLMCVLKIQDATIKALSAAPQQAEPVAWVGLTDKDRLDIYGQASTDEVDFYARAIESALREKNAKQAHPVADSGNPSF